MGDGSVKPNFSIAFKEDWDRPRSRKDVVWFMECPVERLPKRMSRVFLV
jgi:hypothetical protein